MPLFTFGTFFVVWSIAETVGFLVCPVGNQQIEVLLAEGNLIDGLHAVATVSRPTVGSLRGFLEAAFNALAASGIQFVLNFSASHDSRCYIVFDTASRCCFPLHSAGHGCLVARIGLHVRGHRYDLWCRNRCVPKRPLMQRWHVHRILRAFRAEFHTVHSWEEDARGKSHSCLFTDPCVSPILVDLHCFQTVFMPCGTESSELVFSLSAPTERLISTGCYVCAGCAKAVRAAFRIFMLSLSVFLLLCVLGYSFFFGRDNLDILHIVHPSCKIQRRSYRSSGEEVYIARNRLSLLCFSWKGSVSLFCSFPFAVGWHVLCPVLVVDVLSYFWKAVSLRGAVQPCSAALMRTAALVGHPGSLQATDRVAGLANPQRSRPLRVGHSSAFCAVEDCKKTSMSGDGHPATHRAAVVYLVRRPCQPLFLSVFSSTLLASHGLPAKG